MQEFDTGVSYFKKREYGNAIECFKKIRIDHPTYPLGLLHSADAYFHLGNLDVAGAIYLSLTQMPVETNLVSLAYSGLGNIYFVGGDINKSNEYYMKAISSQSKNDAAYLGLANIYFHEKKFDDAFLYYKSTLDLPSLNLLDPIKHVAYVGRGRVYCQWNQLDNALAEYDKAIEFNPHDPIIWSEQSEIYCQANRALDALYILKKGVLIHPGNIFFYIKIGKIYRQYGKPQDALDAFSTAVHLNPYDATALIERGSLYTEHNEFQLAQADFDKADRLLNPQTKLNKTATPTAQRPLSELNTKELAIFVKDFLKQHSIATQATQTYKFFVPTLNELNTKELAIFVENFLKQHSIESLKEVVIENRNFF